MQQRPRLLLVATGGTIAGSAASASDTSGYQAGAIAADSLLRALPEAAAIGEVHTEQVYALDSKNLEPAHWLRLATLLRARLADPSVDGIVVTHGTDTLEETACFLDQTLPRSKPVILTAAMRPATACSADGPMNLLQALALAACPDAAAAGPLVVANDRIWAARDIGKRHTHAPDALGAWEAGPLGHILGTQIRLRALCASQPRFGGSLPDALPRVDILPGYAGAPADLIDTSPAEGLVLALAGHGSVPDAWLPAIERAVARGVVVVRASRVPAGGVAENANFADDSHGILASGPHSAWQARVVLMLAIAHRLTRDALRAVLHA